MLRNPGKLAAISFTLAITLGSVVRADSPDDGPGRGVARVSVINGEVSVQRGDSGEWVAAALNAPLVVQDRILTGDGSRAEVQFDYANMVRLAPNSEVRLAELDNNRYLLQVGRGTIMFRVLRDQPRADVEISTPSISVRPVRRGMYRITVQPDGASEITVRSGEAEIYSPKGSERLPAGRTMYARGNPQDPEFQIGGLTPRDEFDTWNEMRDRDLESSRSYQYVSSDVYGAEELDRNGRWVNTPEYGMVWVPYTSAGWAPYRDGRWSWIDYYGWSWISYDPWGWAPYHYGRWFYRPAIGWCWWPGGLHTRHYWSPALVAFFGFGHGGVGIGFGNVGWVPLAPYEPLHRWWGRGYYGGYRNTTFVDNSVHVVNNVNIVNVYRNAGVVNGITTVRGASFGRERISNTNIVNVRTEDLRTASLVRGQVPMAPGRESLRMADREVRADQVRATDQARFFSHRQPAQVDRVPFEQQRQGVEQLTRRTFADAGRGGSVRSEAPLSSGRSTEMQRAQAGGTAEPQSPASGRGDPGWRRMGDRTQSGETPRAAEAQTPVPAGRTSEPAAARGQDNGWRRFGDPGTTRTNDSFRPAERTVDSQPARTENTGRSNTESNWRRFGDPGTASQAPGRSVAPTTERSAPGDRGSRNDSGWQRFNDGATGGAVRSNPTPTPSQPDAGFGRGSRSTEMMRSTPSAPRMEAPQVQAPRYEAPRRAESSGFGRSEAVRSAPPIVRERSSGGGGGSRGDGGSHNSGGGGRSSESRGSGGRSGR